MKTITPAALQKVLEQKPDAILLDVRTPVEFAEVHVPQANNIPLGDLTPADLPFPKSEAIYLLCASGKRADVAARRLEQAGFSDAQVVAGGTQAWVQASLPVKRGEVKAISLERQVRIAAGLLVVTGILLGWLVNRYFFGLSAFVGAGVVFAGVTDFCGMGLLLARLPWNRRV
jgi:rhodanese-related sulfurtransferase